jgi:hypothetical protein
VKDKDKLTTNKNSPRRSYFLDSKRRFWRRDPESNWTRRICNPLHNRFAIAPVIYVAML